jgi:hypothetical protein
MAIAGFLYIIPCILFVILSSYFKKMQYKKQEYAYQSAVAIMISKLINKQLSLTIEQEEKRFLVRLGFVSC